MATAAPVDSTTSESYSTGATRDPFLATLAIHWRSESLVAQLLLTGRPATRGWGLGPLSLDLQHVAVREDDTSTPAHLIPRSALGTAVPTSSLDALALLGADASQDRRTLAADVADVLGGSLVDILRAVATAALASLKMRKEDASFRRSWDAWGAAITRTLTAGQDLRLVLVGVDTAYKGVKSTCDALLQRAWPDLDVPLVLYASEAQVLARHCLVAEGPRANIDARWFKFAAGERARFVDLLIADFGRSRTEYTRFEAILTSDRDVIPHPLRIRDCRPIRIAQGCGNIDAAFAAMADAPETDYAGLVGACEAFAGEKWALQPDRSFRFTAPGSREWWVDGESMGTELRRLCGIAQPLEDHLARSPEGRHDGQAPRQEPVVVVTGETLRMDFVRAHIAGLAEGEGTTLMELAAGSPAPREGLRTFSLEPTAVCRVAIDMLQVSTYMEQCSFGISFFAPTARASDALGYFHMRLSMAGGYASDIVKVAVSSVVGSTLQIVCDPARGASGGQARPPAAYVARFGPLLLGEYKLRLTYACPDLDFNVEPSPALDGPFQERRVLKMGRFQLWAKWAPGTGPTRPVLRRGQEPLGHFLALCGPRGPDFWDIDRWLCLEGV
ncbi:hypothetical protein GQ53DRAFT_756470 [Thozetella sp. PMI_491]|nr:hypothetical protein GQ53DRAFT_756470 [Thozetella sp. PMI_491]